MMQPGIYDFSNEDYHASDGISRSGIMQLKRSPYHYWYHYLNPDKKKEEKSDALIFGDMIHTYILEPQLFSQLFYVSTKMVRRGAKWEETLYLANGREVIFEDDLEVIKSIDKAIKAHPLANRFIQGAQYEKSLYWIDPATEILCKARPDILRHNLVCDLKTAKDASERAFSSSIVEYGYHIQCAMLREASRHLLEKDIEDFVFIIVEKDEPHAVAVYQLDEAAVEKGKEEFMINLLKYKECLRLKTWPGYSIKKITIPGWAL